MGKMKLRDQDSGYLLGGGDWEGDTAGSCGGTGNECLVSNHWWSHGCKRGENSLGHILCFCLFLNIHFTLFYIYIILQHRL